MMGLLMLGSVINYLTRATLAVAAPSVLKDLDITTQQYSWILSAFQFAIMLQPLCGYVMDSMGLKVGFAIFAVAWSFISMAHGLAGTAIMADFDWFEYRERDYVSDVSRMENP